MAYGQKCYGSTEDTEGTDGWELDGIFLGSLRLEIFGGNLNKDIAYARNKERR